MRETPAGGRRSYTYFQCQVATTASCTAALSSAYARDDRGGSLARADTNSRLFSTQGVLSGVWSHRSTISTVSGVRRGAKARTSASSASASGEPGAGGGGTRKSPGVRMIHVRQVPAVGSPPTGGGASAWPGRSEPPPHAVAIMASTAATTSDR
jgi:hypothetical protein